MPAQLAASRALQPASSSLQFVHIPKNGGSSIEMFAGSIGRQWAGARDDWPEGPTPLCAYDFSFSEGDAVGGGSKWHVPPHVWKAHGQDPYAGSENFCVVRNPYTRIVSEFVYNQAFGRAGPGPECDGSVLNAWVNASLSAMIQLAVTPNAVPPANAGKYDCHLLPAAYYVGGDGCEHVLHFETLNSDFARLMADREGIADAELPHSNPAGCQMPVSLLDDKSRALIQQVFADDFAQFAYSTQPPHDGVGYVDEAEQMLISKFLRRQESMHKRRQGPAQMGSPDANASSL